MQNDVRGEEESTDAGSLSQKLESGGIFEEVAGKDDDEESIEEFDPEELDLEEQDEGESKEKADKVSPAVYKYDMTLKSYVRLESGIGEEATTALQSEPPRIETRVEEDQKEAKQPNILKRRLTMPAMTASVAEETGGNGDGVASKVQKLDFNPLSIKSVPEEDGIMYMTMKSNNPNEFLLVKVNVRK